MVLNNQDLPSIRIMWKTQSISIVQFKKAFEYDNILFTFDILKGIFACV